MRQHDHSPYFSSSICTKCLTGSPSRSEELLRARLQVAHDQIRALLALQLERPPGVIDLLATASKLWAIRAMHHRDAVDAGMTHCQECHKPWPCPTRIATD